MKNLFASLALAASLAAPVEVEAKFLPLKEPNKIEYTQSTQKLEVNDGFQQVQYQEDSNQTTDEELGDFGAAALFLFLVALAVYFFPTTIAMGRKSNLTAAVLIVNLFLGWTGIFWIVALVMAVLPKSQAQTIIVQQSTDGRLNTTTTSGGVEKITY